jgi:hypothetical protein
MTAPPQAGGIEILLSAQEVDTLWVADVHASLLRWASSPFACPLPLYKKLQSVYV